MQFACHLNYIKNACHDQQPPAEIRSRKRRRVPSALPTRAARPAARGEMRSAVSSAPGPRSHPNAQRSSAERGIPHVPAGDHRVLSQPCAGRCSSPVHSTNRTSVAARGCASLHRCFCPPAPLSRSSTRSNASSFCKCSSLVSHFSFHPSTRSQNWGTANSF